MIGPWQSWAEHPELAVSFPPLPPPPGTQCRPHTSLLMTIYCKTLVWAAAGGGGGWRSQGGSELIPVSLVTRPSTCPAWATQTVSHLVWLAPLLGGDSPSGAFTPPPQTAGCADRWNSQPQPPRRCRARGPRSNRGPEVCRHGPSSSHFTLARFHSEQLSAGWQLLVEPRVRQRWFSQTAAGAPPHTNAVSGDTPTHNALPLASEPTN